MNKNQSDGTVYDMLILGGGPGGYTAALYAARAGLNALLIEKMGAGGQMVLTHQIDNYPGFEEGIDGFTLGDKMKRQAERFGAVSRRAQVLRADLEGDPKVVETNKGTFLGRTVVLATGADPAKLGLPEEDTLVGRGVTYCAACDGMLYRDKTVVVVGGGDTAAADALLLSRIVKQVILVHRRDTLRATKVYHDALMQAENLRFCWNSQVVELLHEDKIVGVRLKDVNTGAETDVACDGVFVCVGRRPATGFLEGALAMDERGYVIAGEDTRTNLPGVYAVGDLRTKSLRQVVTAVADGAVAVHAAEAYLAEVKLS